jgi:hypothetical protein
LVDETTFNLILYHSSRLPGAFATPIAMSEQSAETSGDRLPPQSDNDDNERALRVSQLDADELDTGLVQMLAGKITQALSAFSVSSYGSSHK